VTSELSRSDSKRSISSSSSFSSLYMEDVNSGNVCNQAAKANSSFRSFPSEFISMNKMWSSADLWVVAPVVAIPTGIEPYSTTCTGRPGCRKTKDSTSESPFVVDHAHHITLKYIYLYTNSVYVPCTIYSLCDTK
jgi:hypothetical protein